MTAPDFLHHGTSSSTPNQAAFICYNGIFYNAAKLATPTAHILLFPEAIEDPSWYINSGTSAQVTNNSGILLNFQLYIGSEQLNVGDGNGL